MIIVKLIGGLGNQMFQYAVGRRTAYVNHTELKLDITGYENQKGITPREYMLHVFNIRGNFATLDEIQDIQKQSRGFFFKYFPRLTSKIIPYYRQAYIRQRYLQFDPNILKVSDNTYLEGHWRSEKFFQDIEDIIRQEFTFKKRLDEKNKINIYKIMNSNSISIHVRRGDYVNDNKTNKRHGVCNLNYYKEAINVILNKISNPTFFIFSDDSGWVKQNLKLSYPNIIVDCNFQKKDYEDLRLMSLCKHNIISNSSFGWWGAWLNQNPNKIVIAPKKWFKEPSINTKDVIPKSWLKI